MGLRKFIGAVGERWWLVLATAAVVTLTAIGVSYLQSPTYRAQATVLLTQQNAGATIVGSPQPVYSGDPQRDIQTQMDVMRSSGLLRQVIVAQNLETTPVNLLKRVTVSADGQTNIVTIDVLDTSAQRAADTANAIADAYVAWSRDRQRESIRVAINDVQKRLEDAQARISASQAKASSGGASAAELAELEVANKLYATLAANLEQLKMLEQLTTGSGSVLASATLDPKAVSPNPPRNAALGLAVGLLLGLGVAFLVSMLDTTIKSTDEAQEVYGAPVLGNIPLEKPGKQEGADLTVVARPAGSAAEAYRMLRNSLAFINVEHATKALIVTSALPSEGKSTVAANLAAVLSSTGQKVVLVCADFHRPGAAQLFDVSPSAGLSDVLVGSMDVLGALQQPAGFQGNLKILPAGAMPPNPSALLGSPAMEKLVVSLGESVDWVIIDSAPLLAVADTAAMARWADGVLMVTRARVSKRHDAGKAHEQLENVGARILGVVLWGLEASADSTGYGYPGGYGTPQTG